MDKHQEAFDQYQTLGGITIAASIAEGEKGTRRRSYEDVDLREARRNHLEDILTSDIDFWMVLLVGIDGGLPIVDAPQNFVASLAEAFGETPSPTE